MALIRLLTPQDWRLAGFDPDASFLGGGKSGTKVLLGKGEEGSLRWEEVGEEGCAFPPALWTSASHLWSLWAGAAKSCSRWVGKGRSVI